MTQRIVDIFQLLDIKVIDHIIVADTHYISMAEKGELPHHSINSTNYDAIELDDMGVEEEQSSFQQTHSF